jgi:tripartite-type tricarboxylate transporter receptor subunit TctC
VVARLNAALNQALESDAVKARFRELATTPAAADQRSAAFLGQLVPGEVERYRKLLGK